MAKTVKRGKIKMWIDGEGIEVPEKHIRQDAKDRDQLVSALLCSARQLHTIIKNEKRNMEKKISDYLNNTAFKEGEEWVGGTTLYNFSMDEAVKISIAKKWTFDEKLNIAKQKIDKVISSRSAGSDELIVGLVNRAFKVDNKGEVDSKQLLGLRQIKCEDVLWQEAMELIADSQKLQSTKTYFYFQEAAEDGKLVTITLDFAAL